MIRRPPRSTHSFPTRRSSDLHLVPAARHPGHVHVDAVAIDDRRDRVEESQRILAGRSEEHTSELQSLMRISYAVFCLKKKHTEHHILKAHQQTDNSTQSHTHNHS